MKKPANMKAGAHGKLISLMTLFGILIGVLLGIYAAVIAGCAQITPNIIIGTAILVWIILVLVITVNNFLHASGLGGWIV